MTKRERKAANKLILRNASLAQLMGTPNPRRVALIWMMQAAKARVAGDKYGYRLFLRRARHGY